MSNPVLNSKKKWSVIIVPSLTANDFDISESKAGYGLLQMKTALLAMSGHLHFDTRDDGDYALHQVDHPAAEGETFNSDLVEELKEIDIVFQNNESEGAAGETARAAITEVHGQPYDAYIFENTRRDTAAVHKYVGVVMSVSSVPTQGENTKWHIKGKTAAQGDHTFNVLKTTFVE